MQEDFTVVWDSKEEKPMLPLDKPSEKILQLLDERSVDTGSIDIYLKLDLNAEGRYGVVWLFLSKKHLYCLEDENEKLSIWEMEKVGGMTIDSLCTTNRVVLDYDGQSYAIAMGTNAVKKKLFCFVEVLQRYLEGESVDDDDKIFENFEMYCPKCGKPYTDRQRKVCIDCLDKKALYSRVLKYFTRYKKQMVIVIVTALLSCVLTMVSPWLTGKLLFDMVLNPKEPNDFIRGNVLLGVGSIFLCAAGLVLLQIIRRRANATVSNLATRDMKHDVFRNMQNLSLSFFNNNQTGKLITRVDTDALNIRGFFNDSVPALIINVITFICAAVMMFISNPQMALVVFIPVPIIVIILRKGLPRLDMAYTLRHGKRSSMMAMLNDNLVGIRVVKAFAKEDAESARFSRLAEKYNKASLKVNALHLLVFPLIAYLIRVSGKAVWGLGGIMVMDKAMGFGEFLTFIELTMLIFSPLTFFSTVADSFTNTLNSAQRVFDVLDAVPEIREKPDAHEPENFRGGISFDNVGFYYNANRPILKNVSFEVSPGESIGLVGRTGAGKTTIVNLILRLYDVCSGSIKVDGVDVKDLPKDFIRKNMAVVSQEVFIFRGTVMENIRYAKPEATNEEVIAAAKAANAHDFIMNLPAGYETVIGGGTRALSGGEKQRVSIARALLMDPKILILDEATAAMDTETERLIQEAITNLSKGKTTITIAHRLSTLKDCDTLYVIENGRIAERGSHKELLDQKGIFYKLYTLQIDAMKKVIG